MPGPGSIRGARKALKHQFEPLSEFGKDPDWEIAMEAFWGSMGFGRENREELLNNWRSFMADAGEFVGMGSMEDQLAQEKTGNIFHHAFAKPGMDAAEWLGNKGIEELDRFRVNEDRRQMFHAVERLRLEQLGDEALMAKDMGFLTEADFLDVQAEVEDALRNHDKLAPGRGRRALKKFADLIDRLMPGADLFQTHADFDTRIDVLEGETPDIRGTGVEIDRAKPSSPRAKKILKGIDDLVDKVPKAGKLVGKFAGPVGLLLAAKSGLDTLQSELDRRNEEREAAGLSPVGLGGDPPQQGRRFPVAQRLQPTGDTRTPLEKMMTPNDPAPSRTIEMEPAALVERVLRGETALGGTNVNTRRQLEALERERF
jgi:hypothetical protein